MGLGSCAPKSEKNPPTPVIVVGPAGGAPEVGFSIGENEFLYDDEGEYFEDGVAYLLHSGEEYSRLADGTFWIWKEEGWTSLPDVPGLVRVRLNSIAAKNK